MKNLSKLGFALLILLSFVSCEKSSRAKGATQGEDLLAYSPKNSNVLFYANVKNLKTSEILKGDIDKYQSEAHKKFDKEFNEFVEITGFDPSKDVDEVMISGNGETKEHFVFTAKGNFPSSKLVAFIESKKKDDEVTISKTEYNGQTLYEFKGIKTHKMKHNDKDVSHKTKTGFVAFINDKVMVAGEEMAVKTALDGKSSVKENSDFMAKVKNVADNDVYSVVDVDQFKEKFSKVPAQFKHNVDMIKHVSFGLSAGNDISFSLVGECLTAVDAENLKDAVKGIIALARMGVSAERDLIDFMNEVDVKNEKTRITVSMDISKERLEKLKNYKDKLPLKEI